MGKNPPRVLCSPLEIIAKLNNVILDSVQLRISGAGNSDVGSSDTLALLGKIRAHFCFPAVPAALQKVSACRGNFSGRVRATTQLSPHSSTESASQHLPMVSWHNSCKAVIAVLNGQEIRFAECQHNRGLQSSLFLGFDWPCMRSHPSETTTRPLPLSYQGGIVSWRGMQLRCPNRIRAHAIVS